MNIFALGTKRSALTRSYEKTQLWNLNFLRPGCSGMRLACILTYCVWISRLCDRVQNWNANDSRRESAKGLIFMLAFLITYKLLCWLLWISGWFRQTTIWIKVCVWSSHQREKSIDCTHITIRTSELIFSHSRQEIILHQILQPAKVRDVTWMSDGRAWAAMLMRDNPFSQFGHHFVLICLAGETVDKVLSRIILDNAVSILSSLLQVDWPTCVTVTIKMVL